MQHLIRFLVRLFEIPLRILSAIALSLVRFYRLILSGYMGGSCRFYPTCSQYAEEAYHKHDFVVATSLVVNRILACRPFGAEGYDPVPEVKRNEQ